MGGIEGMFLFVTSRIAEFAGIIMTIFLMFKGYKAKYVYLIGAIVLISITLSLFSLLYREYFLILATGDILLTLTLLLAILVYVIKNPEKTKDFTPPEDARCPYCNAYITSEKEISIMTIANRTLYFDSADHLVRFLREADFFIEKGDLPEGEVGEVFFKIPEKGEWRSAQRVRIEVNGDRYIATASDEPDPLLKKLLDGLKNRLGSK